MSKIKKPYGNRTTIAIFALLSAFPPLSIDLYLPALPNLVETLHSSQALVNLSLSLFLICFAFGILFWGPISEKYGRKPILLSGLLLYILGSVGCALSDNVTLLIISRMLQGFGGGAAEAVVTAMVKDKYTGRKRESILAIIMAMVVVAPVVSPVAGALILQFMSWHVLFWVLTGIGVISFILSLNLEETIKDHYTGSSIRSLGRLFVVLKNPGFSAPLVLFSLIPFPLMAFIGASSYIYINHFDMSEQMYSYFFGVNALGALVGPLLYIQLSKKISSDNIITLCLIGIAVSGTTIMLFGNLSPYFFAASMFVTTIFISMMRPPSANLLLSQQDGDTGSAASLINFTALFMGSLGMFIASLETGENLVPFLGEMELIIGIICGCGWVLIRKKSFIRQPNT